MIVQNQKFKKPQNLIHTFKAPRTQNQIIKPNK